MDKQTREMGRVKTSINGYEGGFQITFDFDQEGLVDWLIQHYGERWLGGALLERPEVRQSVLNWLTGEDFSHESGGVPSKWDEVRVKVIGEFAERVCKTVADGNRRLQDIHEQYWAMRRYAESLESGIRDGRITANTTLNKMPEIHLPVDWDRVFKTNKEFADVTRDALFAELTEALKAAK